MIKGRIKESLTHPAFISLLIWGVIIFFIPHVFSKYKIKHLKDEYGMINTYYYYVDLDSDGNSERISFDLNDTPQTKIIVSKNGRVMNQYNLRFQPPVENYFYTNDFNSDGYSECYIFTLNDDSIFLNIIDPVKGRQILIADRFIDSWKQAPTTINEPYFKVAGMTTGEKSGMKDLLFFITTGYSLKPRKVYRYDIFNDSLIKSPESGAVIIDCIIADINNDHSPEYLADITATGNYDENYPFSDHYTWLMILDKNLKFLFQPVKISDDPATVSLSELKNGKNSYIVAFNDYFGSDNFSSTMSLFSSHGELLAQKPVAGNEPTFSTIIPNKKNNYRTFFLLKDRLTRIEEVDTALNIVNKMTIPGIDISNFKYFLDADGDGKNEIIFLGTDKNSLVIVQEDFRFPVTWEFYRGKIEHPKISVCHYSEEKPQLYLQFSDHGEYISFRRNALFFFKYPIFFCLYFIVLALITAIFRIQRYRLEIKLETERKIAGLQMKAIKNQVDPHFTLNILNAIGSLYANEKDRGKADYIFGKYAKLIRQTVISSDKIIVPLSDELDFIRNYLDLEKFRRDDSFSYSIETDQGIDSLLKVPRMLIYTFVENAAKYGISNRSQKGNIKIAVCKNGSVCLISVEDNGPGLQTNGDSNHGTGKGLVIVRDLIELYFRLEKIKISYTLENKIGPDGNISGTLATIIFPVRPSESPDSVLY